MFENIHYYVCYSDFQLIKKYSRINIALYHLTFDFYHFKLKFYFLVCFSIVEVVLKCIINV